MNFFGQQEIKECALVLQSPGFSSCFYVVVLQKSLHCHFLKKDVCVTEITIPGETFCSPDAVTLGNITLMTLANSRDGKLVSFKGPTVERKLRAAGTAS